LNNV
jgi:hypothetical protein